MTLLSSSTRDNNRVMRCESRNTPSGGHDKLCSVPEKERGGGSNSSGTEQSAQTRIRDVKATTIMMSRVCETSCAGFSCGLFGLYARKRRAETYSHLKSGRSVGVSSSWTSSQEGPLGSSASFGLSLRIYCRTFRKPEPCPLPFPRFVAASPSVCPPLLP